MPSGDGTGPAGMGPMTGRAAGYCAGYPVPGYMNPGVGFGRGRGGFGWGLGRGRGFGRGFGRGRGWQFWGGVPYGGYGVPYAAPYVDPYYAAEITPKEEAGLLKEQAKAIQEELKAINERLVELEKEKK